ncbi:hypothetical protein LOTGIDRAFT_158031 [Lottia gigantea]|uniref:C-type lectin domain-containing protein n=1 Tax=Lottia gigantea TaxID=225164 RepID=V4CFE4_LOTGI|nr:hypothetical protein LOTGIDRAFT_158031 [Lottia gigantea]ESP00740.1 hypothetical protein LOTGIDRAFT_158031 [Lottia gigantea]
MWFGWYKLTNGRYISSTGVERLDTQYRNPPNENDLCFTYENRQINLYTCEKQHLRGLCFKPIDVSKCLGQKINGNCYWLSTDEFKKDLEAQSACENGYGVLADFGKSQENDTWAELLYHFNYKMRGYRGIWLGYHDNPWYDMLGNKLDVSHWKHDYPKNEKCVVSYLHENGLLKDKNCGESRKGLCVKHTLYPGECVFHVNDKCYFLTDPRKSYVAEVECRNKNATLVNITDALQWEILSTELRFEKHTFL